MKTKLLRKLRLEAKLKYKIKVNGNGTYSIKEYGWLHPIIKDIDEAKELCIKLRKNYINAYIYKEKEHYINF